MRLPRLSTALGGGFAVWGLAIGLVRLHDNSFLTHVATGRLILADGIPRTDPYSFTAHGHPWIVESWLAEVLYGAVDRLGSHGLLLLHAALAAVLAGLVWTLTRPAQTLMARVVVAGGALAVGTGYWSPRPLLIALVLLGVVVLMAETERGSPWLLVPVMWVWVNVHGSWPLAFAYLVVRLVGRRVDQRAERRDLGRLPRLTVAVAVGTLLGAANPLGFRLLSFPLLVVTRHQAFTHIVEWQSPNFSDTTNALFLGMVLLALLLLVVRRGKFEDGLVVVLFAAAACVASRNVPVAALVTVPVLARGLARLGSIDGARRGAVPAAVLAVWVALGGVAVGAALQRPQFDFSAYPVAAVTYLQHRGLVPGRVATQDFVGNYLELRYGARASAFIDDRVGMYPSSVEAAYGVLLGGRAGWEAVLDRYRVTAVLWQRSEPLATLVTESRHWRVVWHDRRWLVAVRAPGAI